MSARSSPVAMISTKVPSSGRARRTLASAAAIDRQDPLDAFSDMLGRQRRSRDVADVVPDLESAAVGLADELCEPARTSHVPAVGLAVLKNLYAAHLSAGIQRHRVIDVEVLSDHMIDNEEPEVLAAGLGAKAVAVPHVDKARGRWKSELLRFSDAHILNGVSRRTQRQ